MGENYVSTHLPNEFICPHCGIHIDACSNFHGIHLPKIRDFSICINCGELSQYHLIIDESGNNIFSLRLPDEKDIEESKQQPGLWEEIEKMQAFIKKRNAKKS